MAADDGGAVMFRQGRDDTSFALTSQQNRWMTCRDSLDAQSIKRPATREVWLRFES